MTARGYTVQGSHTRAFRLRGAFYEYAVALAFLLPSLVFLVMFLVLPLAQAMQLSFFRWDGLSPSMEFVGTGNYTQLLTDPRFLWSLARNGLWLVLHLVLAVGGGLLVAALIAELRWRQAQTVFRTLAFLPYALSLAVVGVIWGQLYHPTIGLINDVLDTIGLGFLAQTWLGDRLLALPAVSVASGWQAYGFYMVIFLAGIQSINPQLYEAAMIDGANAWHRFRYVTLPSLRNVTTLVLTLALINSLKGFDSVWAMTSGGPGYATELVAVYVWRVAFQVGDVGKAAAAGLFIGVVVMVLTIVFNRWREGGLE